ncbi:MAG: type II toxin-antitoxin system PemK/MazF family toxin [Verrucomicrobiota bacterium]|jgi:mRNA-degrading endonuclease toxin of MazEF toxin-antitoxin module
MTSFKRGDVVLVDLGYVAKVRPCVVISIPAADSRRNMSVVAPLTTEIRGGECEVPFPKPKSPDQSRWKTCVSGLASGALSGWTTMRGAM